LSGGIKFGEVSRLRRASTCPSIDGSKALPLHIKNRILKARVFILALAQRDVMPNI